MEEGFQANRFVHDAGNINAVRKVEQLCNIPVVIVDGYWVILRIALMVVEDYIRIFLQRGEGSEKKIAGTECSMESFKSKLSMESTSSFL